MTTSRITRMKVLLRGGTAVSGIDGVTVEREGAKGVYGVKIPLFFELSVRFCKKQNLWWTQVHVKH